MSTTVTHIACFEFKADRTPEQIAEVFPIIEDVPHHDLPHQEHQAAVTPVVPQLESVIVCDHEA